MDPAPQWPVSVAPPQGDPRAGVPPQGPPTSPSGGVAHSQEAPTFWAPPAVEASAPRRGGLLVVVSVLIVLALGIGGFTIWKVFFSAQTGAETPEEAVTGLLEAGADQDGVAGLRLLNPDEVRGADEVWDALQNRLTDADMLDDGQLSGTTVEFGDLETEVEQLSDHVAKVAITGGTVSFDVTFADLPEQFDDAAAAGEREYGDNYAETLDFADFRDEMDAPEDFFMIALEKDGRWYVSPVATVAEWLALSEGEAGDWELYEAGHDRNPVTAEQPEQALEVLADSFRLDDLDAVLDALPDGQGDLLRPYTTLLEEDARNDGAPDMRYEFHGDEITVGDEHDGLVRVDLERVRLDQYDAARPDERAVVGLDGACGFSQDPGQTDVFTECLPDDVLEATGEDGVFVMVREVDGGWQLDPMATLIAWADVAVANLSDSDVGALLDLM